MNFWPNKLLLHTILIALLTGCTCRQKEEAISEEQYLATRQKMTEVNRILVQKDAQRIKGYTERQQLNMQETETGLWYAIHEKGEGTRVVEGKMVKIVYSVSLLDGTECYNSARDGDKEFLVGKGGVESGLEEGILMLNEGGKADFIMPPHLAHGLPGDGKCIPARAIIHYKVEVLSVK
jgi:FKBP-type peptidyl-prolyl cis-trans isomerase FkpA